MNKQVVIKGGTIFLPINLYQSIGCNRIIMVSKTDNNCLVIASRTFIAITVIFLRHLLKSLISRSDIKIGLFSIKNLHKDGAFFTQIISRKFCTDNEYYISNYHPSYLLTPVSNELVKTESVSRQMSWEKITGYHEHLEASQQEASANKTSKWLAEDIFSSFSPTSFLELGCGAGRNLLHIAMKYPNVNIYGVDINSNAIDCATKQLAIYNPELKCGSIYELSGYPDSSIDIVYTAGVLMHIPHDKAKSVIAEMHRIAKKAVIHFELHGPANDFDYHRYPRDYNQIYEEIGEKVLMYEIFPSDDFRSHGTRSFNHALLISPK